MTWIATHITIIMNVAGALTCSMVAATFFPQAALRAQFGQALEGPVADVVVRSWGALIALIGASLVYGAYHQGARRLALMLAISSKVLFVSLVFSHGSRFLSEQVIVAVAFDVAMVLALGACLIAGRRP